MKKALLILVLILIPLSVVRLLFGLNLDENSVKLVEERKQSEVIEETDQQLINKFQAATIPESFNGSEVWVPPSLLFQSHKPKLLRQVVRISLI